MNNDLKIAQANTMETIDKIAQKVNICDEALEMYGK